MLTSFLYYIYNKMLYICMQSMEDNEYLKMFAQRVRTLREEKGMSQEKLADDANSTVPILAWWNGLNATLHLFAFTKSQMA